MATISASLIVKNEESVMQRCLDSVSQWADEIIVVDTGSTDRTDWIIWWDADDYIDKEGAARIRYLAETTTGDCMFSFVCSYGALRFEHSRMFRNGKEIAFDKHHSCHEYLNSGGRVQYMRNDIVVQHLPGKKGVPSAVRNLAIMEKDYFERGYKDQRTMFYLANSYKETGRHDEAVKMYNEYLQVSQWKEERYFATLYKAQIFSLVGNFKDAFKSIYESFIEDDRFAESYCLMGDILMFQGNPERARHWFELALQMEVPSDSRLFASHTAYDSYPRAQLEKLDKKTSTSPQEEQPKPESKPEPQPNPEGKEYKYRLPEDKSLALFAMTALKYLADSGKNIVVVPSDEWQEKLCQSHAMHTDKEGGMELSLPSDLRGRSEVEWYCCSAGFVKQGPFPPPIEWETNDVA
jgi:tetratricopeptide (TPR) repeat protein